MLLEEYFSLIRRHAYLTKRNENMTSGRLTDYKEEYCEHIVREAEKDRNMYSIAEDFKVCFDTLQEWKRVHKTFSSAYARARNIQTGLLFEKVQSGLCDRNFNVKAAGLLLAHVARLSEQRNVQVDNISKGTLSERVESVLNTVENGTLTADEVSKLVSAISLAAKIDETTALREELKDAKEQLRTIKTELELR